MAVSHISLISVPVTDQARAKEFYEKLGFHTINDHEMTPDEMPPEPGLRWVQLATPRGDATIVLANWQVGGLKPGAQHLSLGCADAAATHAEVTGFGIDASPIIEAPFGAFFSLEDPDGNGLLIVQQDEKD